MPAGAGKIAMAPRRNGRSLWGYARACCGRLCESVPSSTLMVHRLSVTKDGSPTHRPASLWSFHATPQACRRELRQGALTSFVGVLALPASGCKPVQPPRGDTESATSPFGSGRPVRPWLVVNPGGGAAAPWASWPQPSSANNFPAAARLPRGTNSLRFQVLHCVSTASGAASPSPAGRFTTRTHWRDLVQPERRKHHG